MAIPFLATYGTLMNAFDGQRKLGLQDDLVFEQHCEFEGLLYDLGRFPGAVPGEGRVQGELFRVRSPRSWAVLDRYEGYVPEAENESLFVRRKVELVTPADQVAWVYWFNGDTQTASRVPSGDWASFVGESE